VARRELRRPTAHAGERIERRGTSHQYWIRRGKNGASHQIWASYELAQIWWLAPFPSFASEGDKIEALRPWASGRCLSADHAC